MKKLVILIFIILWMITIFMFSNQGGTESSGVSKRITNSIVDFLHITDGCEEKETIKVINNIEHIIRKLAHYSLYAIGGFLIFLEINMFKISFLLKILYTQILGTLYACTDELHQLMIPKRSGEIRDVIIDSCGVFSGIIVAIIVISLIYTINDIYKNKNRREQE